MADAPREAWITGIGIVSCLGEGADAHWQALGDATPSTPMRKPSRPTSSISSRRSNLDKQIPKKGDQRQMEAWQRIGTYAAGLALDNAGVKGNAEILAHMDMIVAAGGGERDIAVDGTRSSPACPRPPNPEAFLNERLMSDLRPTLFLAQLSNLLAGNISIVHGVTGSSRTFMGEESAGVDAVRIALARIERARASIALVGGTHNAERADLLLLYEFGGHLLRGEFPPVWRARGSRHGARHRSAHSSCWRRAATPRRAAPGRWRGCRASCRSARTGRPARSRPRSSADVATSARRSPRPGASP